MRRVIIILVIVFSLLIPVITTSCDTTPEPEPEPEAEAWAVIGPDGGEVEVNDSESPIYGTRVEIPLGALTEEVTVTVNVSETAFDSSSSSKCEFASAAPAILIEADNATLSKNCTITLPYSDVDNDGFIDGTDLSEEFLLAYFSSSDSDAEAYLADDYVIDTDANVVHISTDHFSKWDIGGQRYNSGATVDYYIDSVPDNGDDESLFHQEIADAFLIWQTALDDTITFSKTEDEDEADIVFRKESFCEWYDLKSCIATATTGTFIYDRSYTGKFTIYFNTHVGGTPTEWVANDYCGFYYSERPFLRVVLHEIGHTLGIRDIEDRLNDECLGHTACSPACDTDNRVIMRYDDEYFKSYICLSCLDIYKVRSHYNLPTQSCVSDEVRFCDAKLEAVVREAIGKSTGRIYSSDLEGLTSLDADWQDIKGICGLEYCSNLVELDISDNQISDIWPLANLTNLTYLEIGANQISDIRPLANLTNLTHLILVINQIRDISVLANLTNLEFIMISHNEISDISPLSTLTTSLLTICANNNQINHVSSLADLTDLRVLQLRHNQINDVSPLANLTKVWVLHIDNNEIIDISPVVYMTSLDRLYIHNNQISDLSPLVEDEAPLTSGDDLDVRENPLSSDSINIYIPELEARGVTVYY